MDASLSEDLHRALAQFFAIGVGLVETILILLGAAVIARTLRRRVGNRLSATLAPENAKQLSENAVTFGTFVAAVTLLLTFWGVTWSTVLATIGLSTLVVALGLQGVLQSLVAGVFILFERPY